MLIDLSFQSTYIYIFLTGPLRVDGKRKVRKARKAKSARKSEVRLLIYGMEEGRLMDLENVEQSRKEAFNDERRLLHVHGVSMTRP